MITRACHPQRSIRHSAAIVAQTQSAGSPLPSALPSADLKWLALDWQPLPSTTSINNHKQWSTKCTLLSVGCRPLTNLVEQHLNSRRNLTREELCSWFSEQAVITVTHFIFHSWAFHNSSPKSHVGGAGRWFGLHYTGIGIWIYRDLHSETQIKRCTGYAGVQLWHTGTEACATSFCAALCCPLEHCTVPCCVVLCCVVLCCVVLCCAVLCCVVLCCVVLCCVVPCRGVV